MTIDFTCAETSLVSKRFGEETCQLLHVRFVSEEFAPVET
jgi:hypothetical protein